MTRDFRRDFHEIQVKISLSSPFRCLYFSPPPPKLVFVLMPRRRGTVDQLLLAGRFVASGCLDRLCWRALCLRIFLACRDSLVLAGSWFSHFLAFLAFGAVLSRGREASESDSRKASDEAAEASKIAPRRIEHRAPRRPTWPPRGLWGPLGRQLAAKTALEALLGGSWGALGRLLAPLWAVLALPGGPREGSREGLREAFLALFWMVQRQKLKKRPTTCYFNDL